jgi:hypothetical protein
MSAEFIRRKILEGTAAAVPKFCGRAGAQPSKPLFATHHSLPFYHSPFTFAIRYSPLAIRYSPVANRHSPSFSIQHKPCPPKFVHRKIWERGEEGEMACGKFGFQFDCKQPLRNTLDCSRLAGA